MVGPLLRTRGPLNRPDVPFGPPAVVGPICRGHGRLPLGHRRRPLPGCRPHRLVRRWFAAV
eukprot:11170267-Lingulodinium_polyedra.AAC.1